MPDKYTLKVGKKGEESGDGSPKPEPRQCPFSGVAVPTGRATRVGLPELAMEQRECNATCALFDAATGRNCLERVFAKWEEFARGPTFLTTRGPDLVTPVGSSCQPQFRANVNSDTDEIAPKASA